MTKDFLSIWVKEDCTNRKITQVLKCVVVPYKEENRNTAL